MSAVHKVGQEGSRGSAMVTLMIIILLVSIASAAMVGFAKEQVYAVERVRDYLKAQSYAESGAKEAYVLLKTNFDSGIEAPARSIGDGSYVTEILTTTDSNVLTIVSTGTRGAVSSTVKVDVRNYGSGAVWGGGETPPPTSPWAYTVFCNGYIQHNGAGECYGSVHANSYLDVNGSIEWGSDAKPIAVSAKGDASKGFNASGNATIHGRLQSWKIRVTGAEHFHEKVESAVAAIQFPAIDLTPYYEIAQANGQVFNSQNLNGTVNWGTIPGGVRWINGTLTQNGSLTLEGCVIATGNIRFNGSVNQVRVGTLPAIVSRDGELRVNGAHDIDGLVYAKGDVTWNGAGTFDGTILCGGNMTFNGTYGILQYSYCEPIPPGGGGGSSLADRGVIVGWHHE